MDNQTYELLKLLVEDGIQAIAFTKKVYAGLLTTCKGCKGSKENKCPECNVQKLLDLISSKVLNGQ
jgi:hypothetical protein